MNENKTTGKREWVKNAIIIFLAIMLILTFFSNTIMNYSLPEVSAQYVSSGSLSEQIRGEGLVTANQSYEVKLSETRTISSVSVKVGDIVQKGQTLVTLEDSESTELETARKTLDTLKLEYEKALLDTGVDYSLDNLAIKNKEEDLNKLKERYANRVSYRNEYSKVLDKINEYEDKIDSYSQQAAALSGDDLSSLDPDLYDKVSSAKNTYDKALKTKEETEKKIQQLEGEIAAGGNSEAITNAKRAIDNKQLEIKDVETQITNEYIKENSSQETIDALYNQLEQLKLDLKYLQEDYNNELAKSNDYSRNQQSLISAKKTLSMNETRCDEAKKNLDSVLSEARKEIKSRSDKVQKELDALNRDSEDLKAVAEKSDSAMEEEILAAERELEQMKVTLSQKQQADAESAGVNALDMEAKQKEIEKQEELVKELESGSVNAEIVAQVAGRITELPFVAGEEVPQGSSVAKIEMTEKGYTLEMTVTVEQARKLKVGDAAEVQYFWYGDASATLAAINPDTANPAKNRILKFNVTGDVTPGQTLQLAIGAKGKNYETIVPNSAIREDNNGKFILTVVAKSSPLGNRYIAQRTDIEVLASDDVSSAVSGGFFGGEFIITTSTKPIEAGMQVRLVEN